MGNKKQYKSKRRPRVADNPDLQEYDYHLPVMLKECLDGLMVLGITGTYIDGTLGGGGHTAEILARLDEVLIPLITSMYEAVGYLGVAIAMAVDASSFPVPSEFILPFAGFLVADPTAVEPLTGGRWLGPDLKPAHHKHLVQN